MSETDLKKCRHEGCNCTVPAGQIFCSAYCERFMEEKMHEVLAKCSPEEIGAIGMSGSLPTVRYEGERCECGHPDCGSGRPER